MSGPGMDSDVDNELSNCASDSELERLAGRTHRQQRITDMALHNQAQRRSKRSHQALERGPRAPGDVISPEAKRPTGDPDPDGGGAGVELSSGALGAIEKMMRKMMTEENAKLVAALETRFEKMEKRIALLEGECMDKDKEMKAINKQLQAQININNRLQEQVESMDVNRRLSTLVLTCDDFKERHHNEDIERRAIDVINKRYSNINLTVADVEVAHRLQGDSKVIMKFQKRKVRDMLYDERFDMARRCSGGGPDRGVSGERLRPLFVSESLSATNKVIFNSLMELRRSGGGVASVFTRRGIVYFRRERGGENIRVPDLGQLQRLTRRLGAGPDLSGPGRDPGGPAAAGTGPPAGSPAPAAAPGESSSTAGVSAAPGGAVSVSGGAASAASSSADSVMSTLRPVADAGAPDRPAAVLGAPGRPAVADARAPGGLAAVTRESVSRRPV